jgi:hypothetical protein
LNLVLDLPENLTDLVLDGVRAAGLFLEAIQVRKELQVYEISEIVASQRLVVVNLAVFALGRCPAFPLVGLFEKRSIFLADQSGLGCPLLLKVLKVFQEQQPKGLKAVNVL